MAHKYLGKDQDRSYHLKCTVKIGEAWWQDGAGKNNKSTLVFLIPEDSTELDFFYAKYLPQIQGKAVEMTVEMARPVGRKVRVSLSGESKQYPEGPHFHLMDKDAIEILQKKEGSKVTLRVISEQEEAGIALNASN